MSFGIVPATRGGRISHPWPTYKKWRPHSRPEKLRLSYLLLFVMIWVFKAHAKSVTGAERLCPEKSELLLLPGLSSAEHMVRL